jgi:hypothetical protein
MHALTFIADICHCTQLANTVASERDIALRLSRLLIRGHVGWTRKEISEEVSEAASVTRHS